MTTNGNATNAAVWFEIPVHDVKKGSDFYGTVLMAALKMEWMAREESGVGR